MLKVQYKSLTSTCNADLPDNTRLTKNFVLSELANKEGDRSKFVYIISRYSMAFNDLVQAFREEYKSSISPTSGYRQPEYNKKVGGDPNSLHLQACAMDFVDVFNKNKYWMLSTWIKLLGKNSLIGAINIYDNNSHKRYHVEAFSDVFLNATKQQIRVYTTRAEYNEIYNIYNPLGVEVRYYGK